jgi:hypothetical protein
MTNKQCNEEQVLGHFIAEIKNGKLRIYEGLGSIHSEIGITLDLDEANKLKVFLNEHLKSHVQESNPQHTNQD